VHSRLAVKQHTTRGDSFEFLTADDNMNADMFQQREEKQYEVQLYCEYMAMEYRQVIT
jgi:hypothetical protein